MLKTLQFKTDYRCFKRGRKLEFRPGVNLLVGEQGCGKSTVLQLLADRADRYEPVRERAGKTIKITMTAACSIRSFDFEKNNPRTQSAFGNDIGFQVAAIFSSHGETVLTVLSALKQYKNEIIMMDEPDMALSIRSCHKLVGLFNMLAKNGCQVIAAVHNPIVIAAFREVLSLEHKKWMASSAFIETHSKAKQ